MAWNTLCNGDTKCRSTFVVEPVVAKAIFDCNIGAAGPAAGGWISSVPTAVGRERVRERALGAWHRLLVRHLWHRRHGDRSLVGELLTWFHERHCRLVGIHMNLYKSPQSPPDRSPRSGTDWRMLTIAMAVPILGILLLGLVYTLYVLEHRRVAGSLNGARQPMVPAVDRGVSDQNRRTLVRWIDLGCPITLDYDPAQPRQSSSSLSRIDRRMSRACPNDHGLRELE